MKWQVELEEYVQYVVEVEADSYEHAYELAELVIANDEYLEAETERYVDVASVVKVLDMLAARAGQEASDD